MEKIIITGGSGTVGSSFIENNINKYEIYSYSRNERAQVSLKRKYPAVKILLGSVEDKNNLGNLICKVQPKIIVHAAALKHVDTAEKQPLEMVKSNILGSKNIIELSIENNIPITVGISTDKACNPKNLYGYSKRIMERMFLEANTKKNIFCCTRFGNVAGSNGSVIPFWLNQKNQRKSLSLTDDKMNRLMLDHNEVSEIIEKCIQQAENENGGFILSKKMKGVVMIDLAKIISKNIKIIGLRPGEDLNEDLIGEDELLYTEVFGDYIFIKNKKNNNQKTQLKKPLSSLNAVKKSKKELIKLVNSVKNFSKSNFNY